MAIRKVVAIGRGGGTKGTTTGTAQTTSSGPEDVALEVIFFLRLLFNLIWPISRRNLPVHIFGLTYDVRLD